MLSLPILCGISHIYNCSIALMKGAADNALSYRKKDTLKTAAPKKERRF